MQPAGGNQHAAAGDPDSVREDFGANETRATHGGALLYQDRLTLLREAGCDEGSGERTGSGDGAKTPISTRSARMQEEM